MLKEKIAEDLKKSMKAADSERVGVLRLLSTAIHNKEIEKRGKTGKEETLTDEEIFAVLMTEAKKRKEAIEIFEKGGRKDLAEKESKELVIIQEFLPKQITREEIERAAAEIIKKTGIKDFGSAMKEVMKELRGKADAKLVSEIVKKMLS